MNLLRKVFLGLSRMPPAVMLLIIIVLAVMTTMMVTFRASKQEAQLEISQSISDVVVARKTIPANTKLERSMLKKEPVAKCTLWDDSVISESNAIGKTTINKIPAQAQVRQIDLEF